MANAKYAPRSDAPHKPRDHYQELTDRIIAALEAGTRPWQKPWDPNKAGGPSMPVNGATGRRYRGINTLVLGMSTLAFASNDPRWWPPCGTLKTLKFQVGLGLGGRISNFVAKNRQL